MAMTREEWLIRACSPLSKIVCQAGAQCPPVAVSIGFPRGRGGASTKIGQCWAGHVSADGHPAIFISPILDDPVRILDVLLHELVHAAVGLEHGHRGQFAKVAKACGLVGKPSATTAGEGLSLRLNAISESLGPLPHAALTVGDAPRAGSRLRLYECECPVKVRVGSDSFDATCNACGAVFARKAQ